jgi:hypothetical protein
MNYKRGNLVDYGINIIQWRQLWAPDWRQQGFINADFYLPAGNSRTRQGQS